MRTKVTPNSVIIWLSGQDTAQWANRPEDRWPNSELSGKRIVATFDPTGLVDFTINGKSGDCNASEFNAIIADHLRPVIPKEHCLYDIVTFKYNIVCWPVHSGIKRLNCMQCAKPGIRRTTLLSTPILCNGCYQNLRNAIRQDFIKE